MGLPQSFGRYVLEERIARGGMAEIYRARIDSEGFAKRVCIKRITPNYADHADFITMFRDEASLVARMQHANVVQVFDFGEQEGTLFLAMEYVDGSDLRRLLDRARERSLQLTLGQALQIAIEVCRGLHYAHRLTDEMGRPLGIIHRDISPHNILVSRSGEVKVTDFGIAKASERATHTATGVVKGKFAYCAPEQAAGERLDQRVDQFALGIVLWEALTGHRLFTGEHDASILRKVMFCEVPAPSSYRPDLPPSIETVVMKALAGRPQDRFPDVRQLEHALGRCLYEVTQDPEDTQLAPLVASLLGEPGAARRRTAVLDVAPVAEPTWENSVSKGHISSVFTSLKPAIKAESVDDTVLSLSSALDDGQRADPSAPTSLGRWSGGRAQGGETAVTRTLIPHDPQIVVLPTAPLAQPPARKRRAAAVVLFALLIGSTAVILWKLGPSNGKGEALLEGDARDATSSASVPLGSPAEEGEVPLTTTPRPPAPMPVVAEPAASTGVDVVETAGVEVQAKPSPFTSARNVPRPPVLRPRRQEAPASATEGKDGVGAGRVLLELDHGWAHAYEGERRLCETPCTLELPAGPHDLRLVTGEGKVLLQSVMVKANRVVRVVVPTSSEQLRTPGR